MGRRPDSRNRRRGVKATAYPIFSVRMPQAKIERFKRMAAAIQEKRNKSRAEGEPFVYLSDVISEALAVGLVVLKRK